MGRKGGAVGGAFLTERTAGPKTGMPRGILEVTVSPEARIYGHEGMCQKLEVEGLAGSRFFRCPGGVKVQEYGLGSVSVQEDVRM